jgi:hypothetical protein
VPNSHILVLLLPQRLQSFFFQLLFLRPLLLLLLILQFLFFQFFGLVVGQLVQDGASILAVVGSIGLEVVQ